MMKTIVEPDHNSERVSTIHKELLDFKKCNPLRGKKYNKGYNCYVEESVRIRKLLIKNNLI